MIGIESFVLYVFFRSSRISLSIMPEHFASLKSLADFSRKEKVSCIECVCALLSGFVVVLLKTTTLFSDEDKSHCFFLLSYSTLSFLFQRDVYSYFHAPIFVSRE